MNKLPNRNTVRQVIAPGIWEDEDGNAHFSLPDLLKVADLEDTPENRQRVTAMIRQLINDQNPGALIVERATHRD